MNPIPWNELPLWKQVFTGLVTVVTLGGWGYVMFHDWKTSPKIVKYFAVGGSILIAAVALGIALKG